MKKSWGVVAIALLAAAGLMAATLPNSGKDAATVDAIKDGLYLVESVPDGRHITLVWGEKEVKVGIRGIEVDAITTPTGEESASVLRRDILGIKVLVRDAAALGDGTYEAEVQLEGQNIAERLVSAGLATATQDGPLKDMERAARSAKAGNWAPPVTVEQPTDAQSAAPADGAK
ncbi:hypothetical protein [Viridibacterium curvum]|uniref:Nuclease n=1 Tax=Viridibacterium curvum TaxID=1101404 RepID=A0ABP9QLY2_9RHOO